MQSERRVPSLSASTPNSARLVMPLSGVWLTARSAPRSDSVSRSYWMPVTSWKAVQAAATRTAASTSRVSQRRTMRNSRRAVNY